MLGIITKNTLLMYSGNLFIMKRKIFKKKKYKFWKYDKINSNIFDGITELFISKITKQFRMIYVPSNITIYINNNLFPSMVSPNNNMFVIKQVGISDTLSRFIDNELKNQSNDKIYVIFDWHIKKLGMDKYFIASINNNKN